MNKEILEGTKKIAEFMGATIIQAYSETHTQSGVLLSYDQKGIYPENQKYWSLDGTKYHSKYDWIMPVVDKIEKLGYNIIISKKDVIITPDDIVKEGIFVYIKHYKNNKSLNLFNAVIEFIETI